MARAAAIRDVDAHTPIGAFAARVVDTRAREIRELLAAPPGDEARAVHDRRVAIRRLRTALEVFARVLPKRARRVRRALKREFAALGPRRDADVAIAALHAMEDALGPGDRPGFAELLTALDADGAAGRLFDPAAVLAACEEASALAAAAPGRDARPAGRRMARASRRRLADVRVALGALDGPADPEALHDLRIAAKRLRYVLEAAAPALGDPAQAGAGAARELQDVLGELHDCDVMLPRVEALRRELRAADVAAVREGAAPPHADRYRGLQTVETRLLARRAELLVRAGRERAGIAARLDDVAAGLGLTP